MYVARSGGVRLNQPERSRSFWRTFVAAAPSPPPRALQRHAGRVAFADGDRRRLLRVQARGEHSKKNRNTLHKHCCDWQKREVFATYDLYRLRTGYDAETRHRLRQRSCPPQRSADSRSLRAAVNLQKKYIRLRLTRNGTRNDSGKIDLLPREGSQKSMETAADVRKSRDQGGLL